MITGAPTRPSEAATEPRHPQARAPTTIDMLTMFGPGSVWQSDKVSVKSSAVSQALRSTRVRRANGSVPPNPDKAMTKKVTNSAQGVGVPVVGDPAVGRPVTCRDSAPRAPRPRDPAPPADAFQGGRPGNRSPPPPS